MESLRVGIDVGGTFTDFVLFNPQTQSFHIGKGLTTPQTPRAGVISGLEKTLQRLGLDISQVSHIVHGTTLVSNLIIERKGVKVGLIATSGFRDTLETGIEQRYDTYDLFLTRAEPLVPRYLRQTVSARMNWQGEVLRSLDLNEVDAAMGLFLENGVEAVAVALMHSYRDPLHEQQIRDHIRNRYPAIPVSISSEVSPEIREYPRTNTTVANAYVSPSLNRYLTDLEHSLMERGFRGALYIMLASGGITTVDVSRQFPVRLIESGPAAGSRVAAFFGHLCEEPNVVSFDMGGTTAKASIITHGEPSRANELEAARVHRFKKGSGIVLKVPCVEMIEIGAGGGSIAHFDSLGLLNVGPESAGADPGPVCYNQGGNEPTVTDADLVLGYLNPDYFLGGEMSLDLNAAKRAIGERIAKPLGFDVTRAALGIHEVANDNMATATRVYAAEQGVDIRQYCLVAFGGSGPTHAYQVAKMLHIKKVICPLGAGVASAIGMLVSRKSVDLAQSYISRLDYLDWDHLNSLYTALENQAREILIDAAVNPDDIVIERTADMRYTGQGYEISVPTPPDTLLPHRLEALKASFTNTYEAMFGRHLTDVPVEAITWRLRASEASPYPEVRFPIADSVYHDGLKGKRPVYIHEANQYMECPVLDRYSLKPGHSFTGPAVVEERESTVVVGPNAHAVIDSHLNLVLEVG